jgi:hypothetical protein
MKKLNLQRRWATFSIFVGMTGAFVMFQNFAPHDSFAGHDTSDLYMNSALTDALRDQKREERAKKIVPTATEEKTTAESSEEVARKPASLEGEDVQRH